VLTILYFAWLREAVGTGEERIEPPSEIRTVGELAAWLAGRGRGALADRARIRAAVDQQFVGWDTPIASAREVAFFPPVTGG
jgi:sulfur-carrier protein